MHPARRPAAVRSTASPAIRLGAVTIPRMLAACLAALVAAWSGPLEAAGLRLELREGWAIQSSAKVTAGGEALSQPGFATAGWHRATVPTTVVSALVADGTYPDPYYGMNLRKIPGTTYKAGTNFSNVEMPADSPFAVPWWYRTELTLPPEAAGKTLWLRLDGVNFRFDAWLNGKKIADAAKTAGAFRLHELDVTGVAKPGANALAVLVSAPKPGDLAITFVDWNPMPPDKVMGLYRPVTLTATRPGGASPPAGRDEAEPPALDRAELTVKVFAKNATAAPVSGTLKGRAAGVAFEKDVALAAGRDARDRDRRRPTPRGSRSRTRSCGGRPSTASRRSTTSSSSSSWTAPSPTGRPRGSASARSPRSCTPSGLVYKVNGRKILIRGAGWTSEMMLRYSQRALRAGDRLRQGHGPQHHPARGQARGRAVLRHRRPRGHPRHARLVLLRPLGEVGQVGRRGPAGRRRVAARPGPAPARPRVRLHVAERLRRPAPGEGRAGLPRRPEGDGLPEPRRLLGHGEEGRGLRARAA